MLSTKKSRRKFQTQWMKALKCLVIKFDYDQNPPLSKLNVNSQFYKRLLWYNVFNVYCHNDKDSVMYCYVETESKKKFRKCCLFSAPVYSQKIQQFWCWLQRHCFIFGQNKNLIMCMCCSYLAISLKMNVTQIFPIRGHLYC